MHNTLRPRQDGRLFPDDISRSIFVNENVHILIKILLMFVPKVPVNNIPALVQIMAWRRPGDKPLSEPMMVSLLTHICVTRPQWVNIWLRVVLCFSISWCSELPLTKTALRLKLYQFVTNCPYQTMYSKHDICSSVLLLRFHGSFASRLRNQIQTTCKVT